MTDDLFSIRVVRFDMTPRDVMNDLPPRMCVVAYVSIRGIERKARIHMSTEWYNDLVATGQDPSLVVAQWILKDLRENPESFQ